MERPRTFREDNGAVDVRKLCFGDLDGTDSGSDSCHVIDNGVDGSEPVFARRNVWQT